MLEVTERLPDGGDAIRRRIVWMHETGKLSEVLEQPIGSHKTRRHVLFDTSGNVSYCMGEKPDFLNGVPFVAPVLQSNLLIFCERIIYANGKTVVDFLPEKEHEVIELW
ncbi:MAG: hypothetical protein IJU44_12325 [Kiritimatiellae bacterium]|nr:hypothetical protein [Kiritimatiellia bacterium]